MYRGRILNALSDLCTDGSATYCERAVTTILCVR